MHAIGRKVAASVVAMRERVPPPMIYFAWSLRFAVPSLLGDIELGHQTRPKLLIFRHPR